MNKLNINFTLNGSPVSVDITPEMSLLTVLKDLLHINSVKHACVQGECGACTVIVDGDAMNSCLILAATIEGKSVTTLEGLGTPDNLHPLQQAFIDTGASQCGFCTPGFIMSAKAFLDKNPNPTIDEIKHGLSGNLCRCTGYAKPLKAIETVVEAMQLSEDAACSVKEAVEIILKRKAEEGGE
jgi:aerobic-type carbon monoxide dehydrogenase small subunit (CoxS/CutS family)